MPTRILNLNRAEPLPTAVDLQGRDRLLVITWDGETPVGMAELRGTGGRLAGEEIARAVSDFPPAAESLPVADLPSVSVVICTCGRPDELARCLEGLARQSHLPQEILVVDNSPEDPGTRELLHGKFPGCRYLPETRRGVTFARNRGVAAAREEVVAFLDDDCFPVSGWLRGVAGAFAREPGVGCCTGPVLPAELETGAQELIERRGGFTRGFVRQLFTPDPEGKGKHYPLQAWMFGTGGNMAFRRSVLSALGGFDEVLPTAEDIEMFCRLIRAGHSLAYEPGAAVRHRHLSREGALRRRLHLWGSGYIAHLTKVALDDPMYRGRALGEMAGWLGYQMRARLFGPEGKGYPTNLIVAEIAGGVLGGPAYLLRRVKFGGNGKGRANGTRIKSDFHG